MLRRWLRDDDDNDDRLLIYRWQLSGMKGAFLRVMFIRGPLLRNNGARGVAIEKVTLIRGEGLGQIKRGVGNNLSLSVFF